MGLQDRVDLRRSQITGDSARQPTLSERALFVSSSYIIDILKPRRSRYLSSWEEPEVRDILTAFGVEDRLAEIQSKYWGCGELSSAPGGHRLSVSYPEFAGYGTEVIHHPASLPKTHSYYRSDMPEKGYGYGGLQISGRSPGIPAHTSTITTNLKREVHHTIYAQVGELQRPEDSSQTQNELALFVTIGINPALFLRRSQKGAGDPCKVHNLTETLEAIRKLGSGKYVPPSLTRTSRCRDYVREPFSPWDIFERSSNPEELDDFFAEYIVDAGLDQMSIRQAINASLIPDYGITGLTNRPTRV